MSRSAIIMLGFLSLSIVACFFAQAGLALVAKGAVVVFSICFVLAAAAGRRFKFDPILR